MKVLVIDRWVSSVISHLPSLSTHHVRSFQCIADRVGALHAVRHQATLHHPQQRTHVLIPTGRGKRGVKDGNMWCEKEVETPVGVLVSDDSGKRMNEG